AAPAAAITSGLVPVVGCGLYGALPLFGPGVKVANGPAVHREAEPAGGLADQRGLVFRDARHAATDRRGPEVGELAHRGGVERAGLHAGDPEVSQPARSEERRVGKEGRCRWSAGPAERKEREGCGRETRRAGR